jgi:catechol 2,3-dioxygenase-like lactoylglutathione lyase family enzyme
LAKAKEFYEGKLGLTPGKNNSESGVSYPCGSGNLFVYVSEFAGSNKATAVAWEVDNVEAAVQELAGKGVTFEHFDMPGATLEGDVHVMGPVKAAWFKDPDGNILNIVSGM